MSDLLSSFGPGVILEGDVTGSGDLLVEGRVTGDIHISGGVVIARGAFVVGSVRARSLAVEGELVGDASCEDLVRIVEGARMTGDAKAERVEIAPRAMFKGRIRIPDGLPTASAIRKRSSSSGFLSAPVATNARTFSGTAEEVGDRPVAAPRLGSGHAQLGDQEYSDPHLMVARVDPSLAGSASEPPRSPQDASPRVDSGTQTSKYTPEPPATRGKSVPPVRVRAARELPRSTPPIGRAWAGYRTRERSEP